MMKTGQVMALGILISAAVGYTQIPYQRAAT
jgi:hypothetical protein